MQVKMKKMDNKQCLSDTPLLVNEENQYQEYKGHTKWLSYLTKKIFWHDTSSGTCSIYLYC